MTGLAFDADTLLDRDRSGQLRMGLHHKGSASPTRLRVVKGPCRGLVLRERIRIRAVPGISTFALLPSAGVPGVPAGSRQGHPSAIHDRLRRPAGPAGAVAQGGSDAGFPRSGAGWWWPGREAGRDGGRCRCGPGSGPCRRWRRRSRRRASVSRVPFHAGR